MTMFAIDGACDCHSHVYGPFHRFPLSPDRTFDPPESPIEDLEKTWDSIGVRRAVLVQGSAHAFDYTAMLVAILRSPETRRGIALLPVDVSEERLCDLHRAGVCGVRFNWLPHLLGRNTASMAQRITDTSTLMHRVASLGWHAEFHIALEDLDLVHAVDAPRGMPLVLDHMARIDANSPHFPDHLLRLLEVLRDEAFWIKLSGADRISEERSGTKEAVKAMASLLSTAPDRCVWGLDWPHVNLHRKRGDMELAGLLVNAAKDEDTLRGVLLANPARLYGFTP